MLKIEYRSYLIFVENNSNNNNNNNNYKLNLWITATKEVTPVNQTLADGSTTG